MKEAGEREEKISSVGFGVGRTLWMREDFSISDVVLETIFQECAHSMVE